MSNKIELNDDVLENVTGGAFKAKSDGGEGFTVKSKITGNSYHISDYSKYRQFLTICGKYPDTLEGENAIVAACRGGIFD